MSYKRDGWKIIHLVAEERSENLLEDLINKDENLQLLTDDGKNMLHIAASLAHFPIVKRLLEVCPDLIDKCDNDGWTALHFSVAGGDTQIFQEIAEKGLSPRIQDNQGRTCLHEAAKLGYVDILNYIIDVCPEVQHTLTKLGRNVLHETVDGGHEKLFLELVNRGFRVDVQDRNGTTCLHIAAAKGYCNLVRLILKLCPEVKDLKRSDETTALHDAAAHGNVEAFIELAEAGIPADSYSQVKGNCLHVASYNGKLEMVGYIVEHYPELLDVTTAIDGWTSIHLAISGGHLEVFELLQRFGANPRGKTGMKGNVLHLAVAHDNCKMLEYLLKHFPDIANVPRNDGWTPLHLSAANGFIDAFNTLTKAEISEWTRSTYGETCLHVAASCGKYKMVQHIVDSFPSLLHEVTNTGRHAIHEASACGSKQAYDTLIGYGVSPDILSVNNEETCLHLAASNGRHNMVSHILKICQKLLTMKRSNGWTAIHDAAAKGHVNTCKVLYLAGSSFSSRTGNGETVKDIARLHNQQRILDFILQEEDTSPYVTDLTPHHTLDEEKINTYLLAVEGQKEKRRNIRLMVVGFEGVGKTTFCWRLMNKNLNDGRPLSTDGIDIYINRFLVDIDSNTRQYLENETGHETTIHRIRDVVNEYRRVSSTENDDLANEDNGRKTDIIERNDRESKSVDPRIDDSLMTKSVTSGSLTASSQQTDTGNIHSETVSTAASSQQTDIGNIHPESMSTTSSSQQKDTRNIHHENVSPTETGQHTGNPCNEKGNSSLVLHSTVPVNHKGDIRRVMSELDPTVPKLIPRKAYASLWDFGGHKDFYNSHHLFLSSDAVYILVFNVCLCLRNAEERKKIKFWLQSIKSHATISGTNGGKKMTPPIMLIGTHIDKVSEKEDVQIKAHRDIENLIYNDKEMIHIVKDHVLCFFTINSLTEPEETFADIWTNIIEAAKYQSQWERLLPARWLTLERELMKRRADGVKVMSVRDIQVLGQGLEAPTKDENDIHEFLRYLHFTGEILKFTGKENKEDIVVIDPQWIAHAFRCFITAPQFRKRYSTRFKILWDIYVKSAVLESELIDLAWGRDKKEVFLDHREILLDIMERFGLIASPPQEYPDDQDSSVLYYVPAMFEDADPGWLKPIIQLPDAQLSCSISFAFKIAIPFMILDKVLALCIQKFEPFDIPEQDCSRWLQRGFACFNVNPQINLILCCSDSTVKATLLKCGSSQGFESGTGYHVRRVLETILSSVLELNNQHHLQYDHYLTKNYIIDPLEHRVRAEDTLAYSELPYWSSDGERDLITRLDYDVWFEKPNPSEMARSSILSFDLSKETLHRQLTDQEMARISKHIGASYFMLFCELGLPMVTMESIRLTNPGHDFRSIIAKMLRAWTDTKGKDATVEQLLLAMKMQDFQCDAVIQCLNDNSVMSHKGLPRKRSPDITTQEHGKRPKYPAK